ARFFFAEARLEARAQSSSLVAGARGPSQDGAIEVACGRRVPGREAGGHQSSMTLTNGVTQRACVLPFLVLEAPGNRHYRSGTVAISTRRFFARPSSVVFAATGCVSPNPAAKMRSDGTPAATSARTTVFARAADNARLSKPDSPCTGRSSVKPLTISSSW